MPLCMRDVDDETPFKQGAGMTCLPMLFYADE